MLPIFYINLASRPDRRVFMEQQFRALGITAERVEATTVEQVPHELLARQRGQAGIFDTPPAYLASLTSHRTAWQRLVDSGHPAALILEDDVVLASGLRDFLDREAFRSLGADLIKLETFRNHILLGDKTIRVGAGSFVRELQSSHFGAAAYIISLAAAQASLSHPDTGLLHTDRFLFGRGGAHLLRSRVLQADPAPCIQLMKTEDRRSPLASSNLAGDGRTATTSHKRPRPGLTTGTVRVALSHAALLARLALRDPAAVVRRRRTVPFAGEAGA